MNIAPLRDWARRLKREVLLLWLAARDPRTPLAAKLLAGFVAGYALSPIDLIPDFIPVLGLLDDLILVPAGIWLALRMIPSAQIDELRIVAEGQNWPLPARWMAAAIIAVWAMGAMVGIWAITGAYTKSR